MASTIQVDKIQDTGGNTIVESDGSGAATTRIPATYLGSGTASSTTVLYGDQTYKTEPSFSVTDITGQTALGAAPAPDTDEFVLSDSGVLKRVDYKWLTNRAYCLAYPDGAQSIANSTTTKVEIDAVMDFGQGSTDAGLDTTNKRLLPVIPGYYLFSSSIRLSSGSAWNNLQIELHKNGSAISQSSFYHASYNSATTSGIDYMNGTSDYIELYVNQNSGGSLDTTADKNYTHLIISRLTGHP